MTAEIEAKLFSAVLDQIGAAEELVNEVIEVFLDEDEDKFEIARYLLPDLGDVGWDVKPK
jgi:hypothetical protein